MVLESTFHHWASSSRLSESESLSYISPCSGGTLRNILVFRCSSDFAGEFGESVTSRLACMYEVESTKRDQLTPKHQDLATVQTPYKSTLSISNQSWKADLTELSLSIDIECRGRAKPWSVSKPVTKRTIYMFPILKFQILRDGTCVPWKFSWFYTRGDVFNIA